MNKTSAILQLSTLVTSRRIAISQTAASPVVSGNITSTMHNLNDILNLVARKTGCDEVKGSSDIDTDLGCYGDDFDELITEYAKTFNIDMTSYLWYFHTGEEGQNIGGAFFKAPNQRVKRIPVTPDMLLEFANKGKWDLVYPPHQIPKKRYDIWINVILLFAAVAYAIYYWFIK